MTRISVNGVSKHYRGRNGSVTALSDITLQAESGEFVCLVGPSGCGKSSLLYMIGGFVPIDSGVIMVDDVAVHGPGIDRGIVFQQYALFPWLTVEDNIAYGLKTNGVAKAERERIVSQLMRMIGLSAARRRYPKELSGGMQQRVALARTLAYDPKILLLDEPFGALDAQTRETMQDELLRIWKTTGKTVLMVTHDVDEAVYLSQRVLVMSRQPGRIIGDYRIDLDRGAGREAVFTSPEFARLRNQVWLDVRAQAAGAMA